MKKCSIGSYKGCVELKSEQLRLAVSTAFGPRIMGCFVGGKSKRNLMAVLDGKAHEGAGNGFAVYGGHRLWHSPEECPRTYEPDNAPVAVTEYESGVEFAAPTCPATGIAKKLLVEPLSNGMFCVTHTIENCGLWPIELAPWALSQLEVGGTVIIPQGRHPDGYPFAVDRNLALWAYTSFADKRLTLGEDYILFGSDSKAKSAAKIGFNDQTGWIAYVKDGQALVKYIEIDTSAEYPDNGCTVESYTCKDFIELETLGPLETLEPGECTQHVEYWQGIDGLPELKKEKDIEKYLLPHLLQMEEDDEECCCEDEECCCGEEECECGGAKKAAKKGKKGK